MSPITYELLQCLPLPPGMAEYLPEPLVPARLSPFYELLLRLGLWRSATPRSLLHIGRTGVRGWHHPSSLGLLAC
jgi:hypothetical protein